MDAPTEEIQVLIDNCLAAAGEALELFASFKSIDIDPAEQYAFKVVYPLAAHAMEEIKAALILIDAGLPYPAEGNVRSAVQHAVTCQWILHTQDAERQVMAEIERNRSLVIEDFSKLTEVSEELLEQMERISRATGGPARNFQQMVARFSPDRSLYLYQYRNLSDSLHPSARTLGYHLEFDLEDPETPVVAIIPSSPKVADERIAVALAFAAIFAVNAVAALSQDSSHLEAINAIADRHQLPRDLASDDQMPHFRRERPAGNS